MATTSQKSREEIARLHNIIPKKKENSAAPLLKHKNRSDSNFVPFMEEQ